MLKTNPELNFLLLKGGVVAGAVTDSDLFRSCSNILDKFGSKPTRDNLAVVNGSNRSPASASFKDFLLGRSVDNILRGIFYKNGKNISGLKTPAPAEFLLIYHCSQNTEFRLE